MHCSFVFYALSFSFINHALIRCAFGLEWKIKIILLFSLFLLLFTSLTTFFGIIHGSTVLFQLTFSFIYRTFNNKFSVSGK